MDLIKLSEQAALECSSPETTAHHGGSMGRGFWNAESIQFMYVPAFQFAPIPECRRYLYEAVDEQGNVHAFEGKTSHELLTPIWKDIPEGVVQLRVTGLSKDGSAQYPVGARTFFRAAPFSGVAPSPACSYRECVERAFDYLMQQESVRHWYEHGTPDPHYDLNIYPSKMVSALVLALLAYADRCPDKSQIAIATAERAADFVLSITPGKDECLGGLPPTYYLDYCPDPDEYGINTNNWQQAVQRCDTTMMIYPASMGEAYIALEKYTGKQKYLDAALTIGEYYLNHVESNGTWYAVRSVKTGEAVYPQYVVPNDHIIDFLTGLYERTKDNKWRRLADGAIAYLENSVLRDYCWEGQFEDTNLFYNYANLTHFSADTLIKYYCRYYPNDEKKMAVADELMRFVEDQFVVWNRPAPWNDSHYDTSLWHTPAGLEQYVWHVPIDGSTVGIALTFYAMYRAGRGELHLAKALALADQVTVMQHADGKIPTHWMNCQRAEDNFWLNCMCFSMLGMSRLSEIDENRN